MEIESFLYRIQGFLKHQQKTLGGLESVKRDNEKDNAAVVEGLLNIIKNENLSLQSKEKLFLVLFLNTDTEIYNDLKQNRNFAHLVGFFPKLSPDLFMNIVNGLQLHELVYKSVEKFPSPLSYKVLQLCLTCLTWIDLFEAVQFVENLLSSLFKKILSVSENDVFGPHLKDVFQRLLLHFDAEKGGSLKRMSSWNGSKLKHYAGLILASLLSLVENFTNALLRKDENINQNEESIFNIQFDHSLISPIEYVGERLGSVQQCYDYVVAKCYENVCAVTVDIWLYWVEIDLDDTPDTENTLQRLVGEKAYTCREVLIAAENKISLPKEASTLVSTVKHFALEPKPKETPAPLELEDILKNIQDPTKDNAKWIKYLVDNESYASEPETLRVLLGSFSLIGNEELNQILETVLDFIKTYPNSLPQKEFILSMVKLLDSESQGDFAEMFVNRFGATEIFKIQEFHTIFVESFNKVISVEEREEEVYRQFLWLAVQSGEEVVTRAVVEGVTSEVRGHLMADILNRLQPFCDTPTSTGSGRPILEHALDHLLQNLLVKLPDTHRANFPLFVRELVMRNNLDGKQFLHHSVLGKLNKVTEKKRFSIVIVCLETVQELYNIDCTYYSVLATVALLVAVLDGCRWTPTTFTMEAVQACELAQQLISQFVTLFFQRESSDVQPLARVVRLVSKKTKPLNFSHLKRLMRLKMLPDIDPALHLVFRMHYGVGEWSVLNITPEERLSLVHSLCFVMPLLTSSEWQELFCVVAPKCSEFIELFEITTDALLLCIDSAKVKNDEKVLNCLTFTLSNISEAAKYELNRWTREDVEYRIRVLVRLCTLLSRLPVSTQESQGLRMLNVLTALLPEGSRHRPLSSEEEASVTAALASLHASNVRCTLCKQFLDRIHR